MSFADKLRRIEPDENHVLPYHLQRLVNQYLLIVKNASACAARQGRKQISFYAISDGYNELLYEEALPMYEGTSPQRAAAMTAMGKKSFSKYGPTKKSEVEKLGYELYDLDEAKQAANELLTSVKKLGFMHCNVEIKQFHKVEKRYKYNGFTGTETITYRELPETFFYLRLSVSW